MERWQLESPGQFGYFGMEKLRVYPWMWFGNFCTAAALILLEGQQHMEPSFLHTQIYQNHSVESVALVPFLKSANPCQSSKYMVPIHGDAEMPHVSSG
jgi:hypothetical protein